MPLIISCPSCARQLRLPDELQGQQVKCPSCMTQFTATADSGSAPTPAPPPGPYITSAPPGPQAGQPFAGMGYQKNDFESMGEDVYDSSGRRLARQRLSGPATAIMVSVGIGM